MWSRIVSLVDDLNNEGEDGYESDQTMSGDERSGSRRDEVASLRQELTKCALLFSVHRRYKDRALQLREELRESETRSQDITHEYGRLIQDREEEIASLRKELEQVFSVSVLPQDR